MKRIKQFLCLAAALCLLLALLPAAQAAYPDETFADKSWDEVVAALMEEYHVNPDSVAMGYYNTVTGETHFHRGDQYMVTASMYKVPLNMVFTERIANGEMDWDTVISGIDYATLLEWSIVNSDNDAAEKLWLKLGGYQKYRRVICPYMGVDPDTVDKMYWRNNYFTAEQMIHCLSMLQAEPERFPRLEETMKKAEPSRWFNAHEQEYAIAHKFGYVEDNNFYYVNDCAICYTDDPICIVLFTRSIGTRATDFLADFCTLMCDYTQYHTALRLEEEAKAEAAAAEEAALAASLAEQEAVEAAAAQESLRQALSSAQSGELVDRTVIAPSRAQLALGAVIAAVSLAALIAALVAAHRGRVAGGWAVLTVLLTAAALLLSVAAPTVSEYLNRPQGDPREAADGFFEALKREDYEKAYSYLSSYSSLGLEKEPDNEVSRLVFDTLRKSYDYRLDGDCIMEKDTAQQKLLLQHLDLNALQGDLRQATEDALAAMVQELPRSELYGEDGGYLPEVTSAAYAKAMESLLAHADNYLTVSSLELTLSYSDEGWRLAVDPALIAALSGTSVKGGTAA